MTSCGKSKAVKDVEEKINAIGTVTVDSESSILDAEKAYDLLSDNEKKAVQNYDTLAQAREEYAKASIEKAYELIKTLDMRGAYETAEALPEKYEDEKKKIKQKIESMCYDNTFVVKLENVVSKLPVSTDKPAAPMYGKGITYGHNYSNQDSMQTAMKEYRDYLNTYYTAFDNTGNSEAQYDMAYQTYSFKDEDGHIIKVAGASVFGLYMLNIAIE